ncbi:MULTISPECIES: TadE/TadG family type IV pilus assembly protein [unclassified Bosea (in: a-proteobacteria)]|uniref:TadE/TadG family type IV pilus assembly protein n=1 Tax=unclassified Bosea (in: a-proteobacteria) TaxID=2653178 RepID=UPI000F759204|nr:MULTISPECIES: TadE/TadG family type IV pilus assembly protein [unclassified Bosea (in: a-proteobacteria)]AZO78774.1 hypothetical protein BLM15_14930 [Bosea sp. Tri-49]RXT17438.1 hypothetical protein B5U98_25500 [Bosea sp. Tri-39]RXT40810.1 hypothetical protein B5U99_03370 [Bosea sp. Tri-54]
MPGLFRSFLKDARGVTALMFGLTLPAVVLAVGGGIDFSRAAARHQRMASAIELACQQAAQEIRYQASQANADPKKDYSSLVKDLAVKKLAEDSLTEVTPTVVIAGEIVTITAAGSSANLFAGIVGYNQVSLQVSRNCTKLPVAPPENKVLFTESFENYHSVKKEDWSVLQNWNGWKTTGGGVEINGIPQLSGNEIRFGNFFAELDSHCYVSGCNSNSSMAREFDLKPGNYELRYWYISRIRNTTSTFAGKVACVGRYPENDTNPDYKNNPSLQSAWATKWPQVVQWARSWEDETNRIEVYFAKSNATLNTTNMVDLCIHTDKWVERVVPLKVTEAAKYSFTFRAAGKQDTVGGLLDYIRFCSGNCP